MVGQGITEKQIAMEYEILAVSITMTQRLCKYICHYSTQQTNTIKTDAGSIRFINPFTPWLTLSMGAG